MGLIAVALQRAARVGCSDQHGVFYDGSKITSMADVVQMAFPQDYRALPHASRLAQSA
jgi:hypothetical protein